MTQAPPPVRLSATYPTARVRGRLVTRSLEKRLDWTAIDAGTADELGRDHVGWFVGDHPGFARAAEQFARLDTNTEGGIWVVVPLGRERAVELRTGWPHPDHIVDHPRSGAAVWRSRKVWVAIPEDLKLLLPFAKCVEAGVAGVIVLDPPCLMYKRAGWETDVRGRTYGNDRPQHVVNFRASLDIDGWQPPLLLLTTRLAMSVDPNVVARAFCLDAFRFIAGDSFGCWETPVTQD